MCGRGTVAWLSLWKPIIALQHVAWVTQCVTIIVMASGGILGVNAACGGPHGVARAEVHKKDMVVQRLVFVSSRKPRTACGGTPAKISLWGRGSEVSAKWVRSECEVSAKVVRSGCEVGAK